MSPPITTASRLDQLISLRNRLDLEIRAERQRAAADGRIGPRAPRNDADPDTGPSSLQVKTWALAQGLITEIRRGRCSAELFDAYRAAHTEGARR